MARTINIRRHQDKPLKLKRSPRPRRLRWIPHIHARLVQTFDLHGLPPGVTLTCGLLPQIQSSGLAFVLIDLLELRIDDARLALRPATGTGIRSGSRSTARG